MTPSNVSMEDSEVVNSLIAFDKFMAKITTFNRHVFLVSPCAGVGRLPISAFFIRGM
jgi:hypothetical protein